MRSKLLLILILSMFLFGIFLIENVSALDINNCVDLNNVRNIPGGTYLLKTNLNCGFINPISTFTGTFDGQGFTISGLVRPLFGITSGATIRNVGLSINFNGGAGTFGVDDGNGRIGIGALVAHASSTTIQNVWVTGSIVLVNVPGQSHIGGLIGFGHNINVANSYSKVNIQTSNEDDSCTGWNFWGCSGGVGEGTCKVGGFIGKTDGTSSFVNCYSQGDVSSAPGYLGGFAGATRDTTTFINDYSNGAVTNVNRGALYCWAYQGAFVGYYENPNDYFWASYCFWNSDKAYNANGGGLTYGGHNGVFVCSGLNDGQMKQQSSFPWDINTPTSVWDINNGVDYPRLWMEYKPPVLKSYSSPSTVPMNSVFQIKCNYGKSLPCISSTHDGISCVYSGFSGADVFFNCNSNNVAGIKNNYCRLFPANDPRCPASNTDVFIGTTSVVQCSVAEDCPMPSNPCLSRACNLGVCSTPPLADNTPCSNSNGCIINNVCLAGVCTGTAKCLINQICDASEGICYDKKSCVSENDNILNLFKPVNSKASTWNVFNNWSVCYSNIFGEIFTNNPNVHDCQNGNNILWLSGNNNADASLTQDAFHTTPVCYGDLKCRVVDDTKAGLVAYYPFNGNANDASGNNNNGVNNGATFISGKTGQGANFNGINNYIEVADSSSLKSLSNGLTIGLWIKSSSTFGIPISRWSNSPIGGYGLHSDGNWYMGDSSSWKLILSGRLADNQWHYYNFVWNTNNMITYRDGSVIATSGSFTNPYFLSALNNKMLIGADNRNGLDFFNGIIDEVKIWNRALDYNEILNENNSIADDCNGDEKSVVRLNKNTNSKVSNGTYKDSPYKVCCKSAGIAYFADMMGKQIENATNGSSVKLIASKTGLTGKIINFSIYDNSTNALKFSSTKTAQSSSLFTLWIAEKGIFYFNATSSTGDKLKSNKELNVSGTFNNKPGIQIISPVNGSHYMKDERIGFNQSSYDTDDDLKIIWDFGDGSRVLIQNILTVNSGDTIHSYTSTGARTITARVEEMTRAQKSENYSEIFVHKEGTSIYAIIDSPNYGNQIVAPNFYKLNGTSSYVEECNLMVLTGCPGTGCFDITLADGRILHCKKLADSSKLNFTWTINGNIYDSIKNNSVSDYYFDSNIHTIELNVSYNGIISDKNSKKLFVAGNIGCESGGYHWINSSDPLNPILFDTTGNGNCYNPFGENVKMCCPKGQACIAKNPAELDALTGWQKHFCNYTGEMYCWNIKTKQGCENAIRAAIDNSFNFLKSKCGKGASYLGIGGEVCYNETKCSCYWNDVSQNCFASSRKTTCINPSGPGTGPGTCDYIPIKWDNQCNETGLIFVQVQGIGSDPECQALIDKTITCDEVVKLGFFGFWNIIEVIVILIFVYVFYIRYEDRKK